jgi:hypothetical protein
MKEDFDEASTFRAKMLALHLGDYLHDNEGSPEVQINASAIAHASLCYSYGLDLHKTLLSVTHMFKQMEEQFGKK